MRGSSWWFLMASNQNLGFWVLFSAESNGIVQIPDFRQAYHYKTKIFGFWAFLYKYVLFLAFCGKLSSILVQITLAAAPPPATAIFCFGMFWRPAFHGNNVTLTSTRAYVSLAWSTSKQEQNFWNTHRPSKHTKIRAKLEAVNKQNKRDLPPFLKCFLIGWTEIITPWLCPKI